MKPRNWPKMLLNVMNTRVRGRGSQLPTTIPKTMATRMRGRSPNLNLFIGQTVEEKHSEREKHKGAGVPHGVGDDKGGEPLRAQTVEKSPEGSYHQRSHEQHEIERPHMYQRIEGKRDDKPHIDIPALGEAALHIAAPENLLGRADDKEQRHRQHARAEPVFHSIYRIHLCARERWKQPLAELVANPEDPPKSDGNADSEEHVFHKIPPFLICRRVFSAICSAYESCF